MLSDIWTYITKDSIERTLYIVFKKTFAHVLQGLENCGILIQVSNIKCFC